MAEADETEIRRSMCNDFSNLRSPPSVSTRHLCCRHRHSRPQPRVRAVLAAKPPAGWAAVTQHLCCLGRRSLRQPLAEQVLAAKQPAGWVAASLRRLCRRSRRQPPVEGVLAAKPPAGWEAQARPAASAGCQGPRPAAPRPPAAEGAAADRRSAPAASANPVQKACEPVTPPYFGPTSHLSSTPGAALHWPLAAFWRIALPTKLCLVAA